MYKIYVDGNLFCDSRNDSLAIISPVVKLQANQAGSFTFTIPAEHPHYDAINRRTSIVSVYRDGSETPCFQGVCTEETVDFYKQKAIVCEGELTYLNDSILRQAHYSVVPVRTLLETYINEHNSQVDEAKRFLLGRVTVEGNATCYTNLNSTMTEIKEDLVDDFGGYIFVRYEDGNKYIDYLAESPKTCNQTIELGKNLLDYSSNIDNTEIATSIIPLGAKLEEEEVEGLPAYVTIKSVNDGKDYILNEDAVKTYGQITKVVNWDDVTEPSNLLRKGKAYLTDIQFENVTLNISAVDFGQISDKFDEFELLDTVRVVSATHGMDRTFVLTEQTLNLNNPENDTITLGTSEKLSMSARSNSQNSALLKRIEQAPTPAWITSAINNATALISGNKGGYVILHDSNGDGEPDEVLVMDTNDISTATKVWRWNKSGFGYSSTGYNGKYGTAITMDGQIVADYIKAGTISGVAINNGNGTFKVDSSGNLTASNATLTNGNINCGNGKFKVDSSGVVTANSLYSTYAKITGGSVYISNSDGSSSASINAGQIICNGPETSGAVAGLSFKGSEGSLLEVRSYGIRINESLSSSANLTNIGKGQLQLGYAGGSQHAVLLTAKQYPQIYGDGSVLHLGYTSSGGGIVLEQGDVRPADAGTQNLGHPSYLWANVYAKNGTIITSDREKKNSIEPMPDMTDFIMGLKPCEYKLNDGESGRTHWGLISQDVEALMKSLGIDSMNFAGFIKTPHIEVDPTTYEQTVVEGQYDYSLRYIEFLAPMIKMLQTQQEAIEQLKAEIKTLKGE